MSKNFNVLNCDPACIGCIKAYKSKHDLKPGDNFSISCIGIPKDYISPAMGDTVPTEELRSMLAMLDPITWAADVLDWHCFDPEGKIWKRKTQEGTLGEVTPFTEEDHGELIKQGKSAYNRPYQAEMLRCTSKRKVFRLGRQCMTGDSLVYAPTGPIYAKDVQEGELILGGTASFISSHEDDIFEITFSNGAKVKVNGEHPFYVINKGWIQCSDLKVTDKVECVASEIFHNIPQNEVPNDLAKMMGYLLSDGYWGPSQSVKFTNNNTHFHDEVATTTIKYFPSITTKLRSKADGYDMHLTQKYGTSTENPIDHYLKELNVYNKQSLGRIKEWGTKSLEAFISGYFNGDGYLWHQERPERSGQYRGEVGFAIGISKRKAEDFQFILWKLGITSLVKAEWMAKSTCTFYRVLVSSKSEQLKLLAFLDSSKYPEKFVQHQVILDKISDRRQHNGFTLITAIESMGRDTVYGWETTSHEIITTCGIRTHNTGKTESLCIAILHALFTHKEYRVLVITPYQSQIELVFTRLASLIKSRPATSNSLKRFVKAPNYTIELHNGSTIRGFTAGTKSGGNADAVRGQKANMLVFDEADYLASADMASALSVITNYPDATVWMSSTPSGKHEKFYDACHDKAWREFYYPSWINPLWTKDLEGFFRGQLGAIEYEHEVGAVFGEQLQGVYQNKYIDTAMTDYDYKDQSVNNQWIYCIGVDWNDVKIGTTIAVVGYVPTTNSFRLVHREVVSKEGWTQMAACNKIVELNAYWNPAWIYIDKGFGTGQDEILRSYGWKSLADPNKGAGHPDSRLHKIVKTYDFGSKITTKDLFTRQDRDKPAKPFLVENSVRRFEQGQIQIPKYDSQLISELRGYIIDHVSPAGIPVYRQGNEKVGDHNLDAFNLALVAFTMQMTPFGFIKYDTGVAFTGQFGEKPTSAPLITKDKGKAAKHRPDLNRTEIIEQRNDPLKDNKQSGAHTTGGTHRRMWSWPGFERDVPRPGPSGKRATFGRNPSRPSRKMF